MHGCNTNFLLKLTTYDLRSRLTTYDLRLTMTLQARMHGAEDDDGDDAGYVRVCVLCDSYSYVNLECE